MQIKAKSKFDKDSVKALFYLTLYKKSNPNKAFIYRSVLCVFMFLFGIYLYPRFKVTIIPIFYIACTSIVFVCSCIMHFLLPKIQYKSLSNMKETENEYIFCDDVIKIFTKNNEYNGSAEIEYSLFVKVYETSKFFFLYQTQNQVFIVDKSTIENGTAGDIKNKLLSYVKDKYIVCKY